MKNKYVILINVMLLLTSCQNSKIASKLNLDYSSPNEFEVAPKKNLTKPSKFTLPKPKDK